MRSNLRRLLLYPFIVSFFLALLGVVFVFLSFDHALGSDFVSFLTGANIIKDGKGNLLYDLQTQYHYQQEVIKPHKEEALLPFRHIPFFTLPFLPLTKFPLLTSYKIFNLVILMVLGFVSICSMRIFKNLTLQTIWPYLPFLFYPSLGSIFNGQISSFLVLLILSVFYSLKRGKDFAAGILSGLLLLKIQYFIGVPFFFFLARKKVSYLKGIFLSGSIILATSIFLSGGQFLRNYPDFLISTESSYFGSRAEDMITLFALLVKIPLLTNVSTDFVLAVNALSYIIALFVFLKIYKKVTFENSFLVAILFMLVFSVHAIDYDVSLLLIPIFILANRLLVEKENLTLKIFILILVFIPFLLVLGQDFLVSPILLTIGFLSLLLFPAQKSLKTPG